MKPIHISFLGLMLCMLGCVRNAPGVDEQLLPCDRPHVNTQIGDPGMGALMATRFSSLEELKEVVEISYRGNEESNAVELKHCSGGEAVVSILESGLSQKDITKARDGGIWDKVGLIFEVPFGIAHRADLKRVYVLARRRPLEFGEGDMAFFDLAETMVANINTPDLAFRLEKDTTEKGYLNTFNHATAQAFITTIFSEKLADFVADVHERKNMAELTTGKFSDEQLTDPNNNPVDNYVDIVNNEWGQELGKQLKQKYRIDRYTQWTPRLLAAYLNDLQAHYSWALGIGFRAYTPTDEVVVTFSWKLNWFAVVRL